MNCEILGVESAGLKLRLKKNYMPAQPLEIAINELELAVISEQSPGWSGRGAEEARVEAAKQAIRDLFDEKEDELLERDIQRQMDADADTEE